MALKFCPLKDHLHLVFAPDIIQSDHWKFQNFSRFIGVDWSLTDEDHFTIKSTEDLHLNINHFISGKH